VQEVLERLLDRYNESAEHEPVTLIIFQDVSKMMIKVTRTLSCYQGNLLAIALKGSAINTI